MFPPVNRRRIICDSFPHLKVGVNTLKYVLRFKYLGHHVSNNLSDDDDIESEIRNMFVRCNTLVRKFSNCSVNVKVTLFRSFFLCLYDIALWNVYRCKLLGSSVVGQFVVWQLVWRLSLSGESGST